MAKNLVIVESPAKAKTIEKYLGKNEFVVKATMGHLRDLPRSQFGVDPDNGFEPKYLVVPGKNALIKELETLAQKSANVFLATDPDREGEAIAWHLANLLGISPDIACRVEFNEITKNAVGDSIRRPRTIDADKVDAQQARRILDRIVGYKLSPLLWKKVRRGLSAGRVQSVAVRLICDREREIQAFIQEEYWSIKVQLQQINTRSLFWTELVSVQGKKPILKTAAEAGKVKADLLVRNYLVDQIKRRDRQRKPYPPFTTSTLQQDASHKLGFSAKKTMMLAQQLYEEGHITYMRTDSTRISDVALAEAREWVIMKLGHDYLPGKPIQYSKKSAQDAHECIRPTQPAIDPEGLANALNRDQGRLYSLIWKRFIASQMLPAVFDTVTISITAGEYGLRASGSILKFPGFLAVYADLSEEDEERKLPNISEKEKLSMQSVEDIQHFTEPPPRFTEAALIKLLEEKGIGRPSTYAPTIDTIQERGYVEKKEKKFHPTPLGFVVVDLLQEYFPEIVDAEFTAGMEEKLDQVAHGSVNWRQLMQEFYDPFVLTLKKAEIEGEKVKVPEELTDIPCDLCGAPLTVKHGRFGTFLGCSKFPDCRYTKPIVKDAGVSCPLCGKAIVERKSKRGRMFYGCSGYPACSFINWNKPVAQTCPHCGSYMVAKTYKNRDPVIECGSASCPSKSRSVAKTDKNEEQKAKEIKKTTSKLNSSTKAAAKKTKMKMK